MAPSALTMADGRWLIDSEAGEHNRDDAQEQTRKNETVRQPIDVHVDHGESDNRRDENKWYSDCPFGAEP
jgi:hypothetical protein